MKKLITISAALLFCVASQAQNAGQLAIDSAIKDGAIGGGFWIPTSGNHKIASYDYLYNITAQTNGLGAGLIVGGDYMFGGKSTPQWNDVKGGFSVKYQFNLGAVGFTNTVLNVYAGTAVATPRSHSIGIGNITFTGLDWSTRVYKKIVLHIDPAFQTRKGQGIFDGNYLGIQAFASLGDGGASAVAYNDTYLKYAYENLTPNQ